MLYYFILLEISRAFYFLPVDRIFPSSIVFFNSTQKKKNQSYQTVFLFVFGIKRIYLSSLNISKILIVKILVLFSNPLYTL